MKENKEETKLQSEQKAAEEIFALKQKFLNDFLNGKSVHDLFEEYVMPQFKSQKPIEQKTMNKQEAIQAMRQGKKVTHRYFDSTEWATITENRIVFEDGVRMRIDDFLSDRQQDAWDTDWSIFQEPLPIEGETQEQKSLRLLDEYLSTASPEELQATVDKINKMFPDNEISSLSELKQEFVDYYVKRREYQNMEDSLRGMFDKFVLPHLLRKK